MSLTPRSWRQSSSLHQSQRPTSRLQLLRLLLLPLLPLRDRRVPVRAVVRMPLATP
jgi:hypothetical protein